MKEDFKKLGLTDNEISVYLSLLKIGETSVGGIIDDLRIHRQLVYNALSTLEQKNMVTRTMKNKIYRFKITDPKIIVENLKKQELIARRLSQGIRAEMKKSRHEHEINVYEGGKKIQYFYLEKYDLIPPKSCFYLMFPEISRITDVLTEKFFYEKMEKIRARKKIYSKNVMSHTLKEEFEAMRKKQTPGLREARYLPYRSAAPVTTIIWPDSISFQSLFTNPFIVDIKNQALRDSFREHFDLLWKIAKK